MLRKLAALLLVLVVLGSVVVPVIADKPRMVDQKQPIKTTFANLKPVKPPKITKPAKKLIPSEEDWKFVKYAMYDLTEEEKNRIINEAKKIYRGNSKLSKEEQTKILQSIAYYITIATESPGDVGILWGYGTHEDMSYTAGDNLNYVTGAHMDTLKSYATWADDHRKEPTELVPWWGLNRHSWVIGDVPVPGYDNYGPDSLELYLNKARAQFEQGNVEEAYIYIGKALHYIEDLGNPFHTSSVYGQAHHTEYESWVSSHWSELKSAMYVDEYYIITDPSEDAKNLAAFSHQYLQQICDIMNTLGWKNNQQLNEQLKSITRTLISETIKYTMGMIVYATKFESPDTAGSNYVPIYDHQTSYVNINDVACSDQVLAIVEIDHTYPADLEVWIGYKRTYQNSYTETKVWDHDWGNNNHITIQHYFWLTPSNYDWRLRVYDAWSGDQGKITDFYVLIG